MLPVCLYVLTICSFYLNKVLGMLITLGWLLLVAVVGSSSSSTTNSSQQGLLGGKLVFINHLYKVVRKLISFGGHLYFVVVTGGLVNNRLKTLQFVPLRKSDHKTDKKWAGPPMALIRKIPLPTFYFLIKMFLLPLKWYLKVTPLSTLVKS